MKSLPVINNKCPDGYIIRKGFKTKVKEYEPRCIRSRKKIKRSVIQKQIDDRIKKERKSIRKLGIKNPKCKEGYTLRHGYYRNNKVVKPTCIKSRGKYKGKYKGPKIGYLNKGGLSKYGYSNVKNLTIKQRQKALKKAIKDLDALSIWRRINAISIYNRYTNPNISKIFDEDKNWIKNNFSLKMKK